MISIEDKLLKFLLKKINGALTNWVLEWGFKGLHHLHHLLTLYLVCLVDQFLFL
jgi:hypothetical protein